MVEHGVVEVVACPFVDGKHTFAFALALSLFIGEFLLLNLNAVFLGKELKRLVVVELLLFHDEMDSVASLSTAETLA